MEGRRTIRDNARIGMRINWTSRPVLDDIIYTQSYHPSSSSSLWILQTIHYFILLHYSPLSLLLYHLDHAIFSDSSIFNYCTIFTISIFTFWKSSMKGGKESFFVFIKYVTGNYCQIVFFLLLFVLTSSCVALCLL